ncbi:MAG TPA: YlxR family protein [Candidatus Limnocylindrales bacterium]|nr:YlxR family protein [Candidatus Limnocylindrales bacterium]
MPTRSCVACRTARPKRELVRVVRTPDGRVTIDETGRAAGRGAYLCRDAGCWTTGLERGALGRALETPLPAELREALQAGAATMMTNDEGGPGGKE